MNSTISATQDVRPEEIVTIERQSASRSSDVFPVLQARPDGPAERVADWLPGWHPDGIWFTGLVLCWAGLATITILVGLAFTTWIVPLDSFESADTRVVGWFADHRTPFWNDASSLGSNVAGGYLIPA